MERTYVGNCGSKRLPDRSTDMLFGVICKENKVGRDQHIGPVYGISSLPTPRLNFFELYARAKRPITFPFHFHYWDREQRYLGRNAVCSLRSCTDIRHTQQ